jgi:hypothetical protein
MHAEKLAPSVELANTTAGFNQRAPGSDENLLNSETLSRSKVKMTKKV